jgi:hypothetical protein
LTAPDDSSVYSEAGGCSPSDVLIATFADPDDNYFQVMSAM